MKKFLCALIATSMLAAQCAAYAETDTITNDITADNDIELTAMPWETIDDSLTDEETTAITDAIKTAIEQNIHPENNGVEDTTKVEIKIPEGIDINTATDTSKMNAVGGILINYLGDSPEYFYFKREYGLTKIIDTQRLSSIILTYKYEFDQIGTVKDEIDAKVNEILMQMRKDGVNLDAIKSDDGDEKKQAQFDAALWLHDYLADTITYDERAYSTDPAQEALVERTVDAALLDDCLTVCEGYAGAYKYILEKIGMECVNVYSDTEFHEWSAVKIGDAWYYVDVTQDDADSIKTISHNFFLVTAEELVQGQEHTIEEQYTHHDGYITELEENTMTFGTEFEGKPWHINRQPVSSSGEEGDESEQEYKWNESVVSSRVVFDGNDRYYCGFSTDGTRENTHSIVYKCGADLTNPEEFYVIDDSIWYTDAAQNSPIFDYLGGLGKYTYEGTDGNAKKTCLYFNSPTKIYELELGAENAQPTVVAEYTPVEDENYNCIFGISTRDTLKYQIMDMIHHGHSIGFDPREEIQKTIACTVSLYESTENPELMDILTYPKDATLNIPDYKKYGVVLKGWVKDLANNTLWDFENDTLTENLKLYADVETAHWQMQPQLRVSENCLTGTVNASISDFDDTYREAPAYMLAIYDNNTLVAVQTSDTGEFKIAPEDNIPYTDTTNVKVYAWSGENEPYLGSASVRIQKPSGEGEGETGDGDDNDEGDGGETGDNNEGDSEGDSGNEGGTGGSETGGENTDSGETNE